MRDGKRWLLLKCFGVWSLAGESGGRLLRRWRQCEVRVAHGVYGDIVELDHRGI